MHRKLNVPVTIRRKQYDESVGGSAGVMRNTELNLVRPPCQQTPQVFWQRALTSGWVLHTVIQPGQAGCLSAQEPGKESLMPYLVPLFF